MPALTRRKALQISGVVSGTALVGCMSNQSNPDATDTGRDTTVPCQGDDLGGDRTSDRWPMAGYGPRNLGYTPSGERTSEPRTETIDEVVVGNSGVVYMDGNLYYGSTEDGSGRVTARNTTNKSVRWSSGTPEPITTTPALTDDTLYVISGRDDSSADGGEGTLHALAREDGSERWTADIGGETTVSPVVAGDTVYVSRWGLSRSRLLAFDTVTGEQNWRFELDGGISAPVVTSSDVFVAGGSGALFALDAESGDERWRVGEADIGQRLKGVPSVLDGTIYVGTMEGVAAINSCSGETEWTTDIDVGGATRVSMDGDTIFASVTADDHTPDASIVALDMTDGQVRWTTKFEENTDQLTQPVVTDEAVYVGLGTLSQAVRSLSKSAGQVRWTTSKAGGQPVVADGALYSAGPDRLVAVPLVD